MSKLVGTSPNQIPSNADLGTMAYQNYDTVAPVLMAGKKNYIINGDFRISQRGDYTSAYTNASNTAVTTVDRWQNRPYGSGSQTITHNKNITLPNGIKTNSLRIENGSNTDCSFFHIIQSVESEEWMSGRTFTISYWYKTNSTEMQPRYCDTIGCFKPDVYLIPDEEWHFISWKMPMPTNLSFGGGIQIHPAFQKKSNDPLDPGDYIEFALVQMELGDVATSYEWRSFNEELLLAYRYYQTHTVLGSGTWNGPGSFFCVVNSPVPMREVPVISTKSGGWSNINIEYDDAYNVTGGSVTHGSVQGSTDISDVSKFVVTLTTSGSQTTGYGGVAVCDRNNDWFVLDADL